jgi:hypothetical protein
MFPERQEGEEELEYRGPARGVFRGLSEREELVSC